jgi:hypothetical protein
MVACKHVVIIGQPLNFEIFKRNLSRISIWQNSTNRICGTVYQRLPFGAGNPFTLVEVDRTATLLIGFMIGGLAAFWGAI